MKRFISLAAIAWCLAETNSIAQKSEPDRASIHEARAQILQIVNAHQRFREVYGRPTTDKKTDNEDIITSPAFIGALTGSDTKANPKGLDFLGADPAKPARNGYPAHSGLDKGSLLDPWGNPFRLRIDFDGDGKIVAPGAKRTGGEKIRAEVICWSLGQPSNPKKPETAKTNRPVDFVGSWQQSVARTQAEAQVSNLVNSIKLYEAMYGILPHVDGAAEKAIPTNEKLIDILTGVDTANNPKETVFLEANAAKKPRGKLPARNGIQTGTNGSNSLLDPWGNQYMVILDLDDDNQITVPGFEESIRTHIVVWSYGPPLTPEDFESAKKNKPMHWIKSW